MTAESAAEAPAGGVAAEDDERQDPLLRRLAHDRRLWTLIFVAVVVGLGLHFLLPKLAGLEHSFRLLSEAQPGWVVLAVAFSASYLACYVVLFHAVARATAPERRERFGWGAAYQIAMAGQAASTIITAAGAGGIALYYWAMRQGGVSRRASGETAATFLVLLYAVYLGALVVLGLGLWSGALPGTSPTSLTLVPALVALGLCGVAVLVAVSPARVHAWLTRLSASGHRRAARIATKLLTVPEVLSAGMWTAARMVGQGRRGAGVALTAVAAWAANIAVLWACFHAYGESVGVFVVAQAFFVGMLVNLLPLLPGGVGSVEAGMIATLLAFGEPGSATVVAVLSYRLIAFWIPTVPEAIAYAQLRRTVARWRAEDGGDGAPAAASGAGDQAIAR